MGLRFYNQDGSKGTWVGRFVSPPPSPPAEFSGSIVDVTTVEFTWSSVSSATGYNLYINDEKENETVIIDTSFTLQDMQPNDYESYVTSVRGSQESNPSSIIEFTINIPGFQTYNDGTDIITNEHDIQVETELSYNDGTDIITNEHDIQVETELSYNDGTDIITNEHDIGLETSLNYNNGTEIEAILT